MLLHKQDENLKSYGKMNSPYRKVMKITMAYETKVILSGLAEFIRKEKSSNENTETLNALKNIYDYVSALANVEGVILKPFDNE